MTVSTISLTIGGDEKITLSIIALGISILALIINFFILNNNTKQLQANAAPRILTQQVKDNEKFREVHITNLGNGTCVDVFCLMKTSKSSKRNAKYLLSKPSREILPGGSFTFYFRLNDKIRAYKVQVIYKDFFGQYYESGYNLADPDDESSHLRRFAERGIKLRIFKVWIVKYRMRKAIKQGNYYTLSQQLAMDVHGLDTKQKDKRHNKSFE